MMNRKKNFVVIAACLLTLFACQQKGSKTEPEKEPEKHSLSGVWFVDEGKSYFRNIVESVQFEGDVKITPLTYENQLIFTSNESWGLKFITSDSVTFLVPANDNTMIVEMISKLNYKLENGKFILSYKPNFVSYKNGEVLSAKYELGEKLTLFLDDGGRIVFSKSTITSEEKTD
jgi:hypothetical protein